MREIIVLLLTLIAMDASGLSIGCDPDEHILANVEQLDQAYDSAQIVFLANVVFDRESENPPRWEYSVITPILKGEVESIGYLNHAKDTWCDHVEATLKGVYLVFWHSPNDPIPTKNTKLVVYGDPNVY